MFEKRLNDRLLAWGTAAASIVVAIPLVFGAINDRAQIRDDVNAVKLEAADQEQRLRQTQDHLSAIRTDLAEVKRDVVWLRQTFDHAH